MRKPMKVLFFMNKSFVFYESWYEVLEDERQEVQWEIMHAVMEYVFRDNLVELKPNAKMAFKFIKRDIDRAKENYAEFIEKQRENGSKGGRPKKNQQNPKNPSLFLKTQKTLNDNVNVNVNVNVKENVKENIVSGNFSPIGDTPKKSFKQFSKSDFTKDIEPLLADYGKDLCNQFFGYWTEKSASGKMRFQLEKTWDTKRRLDNWKRNDEKFGGKQQFQKEVSTNQQKMKEL